MKLRLTSQPRCRAGFVLLVLSATACRTLNGGNSPSAEVLLAQTHAQWTKLSTEPYPGKQDDLFFLNPSLGWYVNGQGKIYKTTDGGLSWVLKVTKPGTYFRSVGFVDERHGFAGTIGTGYFPGVTDATPLYETWDGGDTWSVAKNFPLPSGAGVCAIDIQRDKFVNAGVLGERVLVHVAGRVGGPAYLVRSVDGGEHWQLMDLNAQTAMILDVHFFDANTGFLVGGSDREIEQSHALVLKTTDGGASWARVYESKRPFEMTWKGSFPTREVGYVTVMNYNPDAASQPRLVAKTQDGGRTWEELPLVVNPKEQEFGVAFASPTVGWIGAMTGAFQTLDGGKTWAHVEMGQFVNKLRILWTPGGFVAFGIGNGVYKLDARPKSERF